MAVVPYTKDMPLQVGQYVNCDPVVRYGFAGRAYKIEAMTSQFLHLEEVGATGSLHKERVVKRKTKVVFVSDTAEEAMYLYQRSKEASLECERAAREFERGRKTRLQVLRQRALDDLMPHEAGTP